jgi:hypothetical protein
MATSSHPCCKEDIVFEPEAAHALALAFDQVCAALDVSPAANRDREAIAVRIIELGREGILDPHVLRDRVVREAGGAIVQDAPARAWAVTW